MSNQTIQPQNFDASSIKVTKAKKNTKNKVVAYIQQGREPVLFETYKTKVPFGVTSFNKGESENKAYSINISAIARTEENQGAVDEYYSQFEKFDEMMIDWGFENQETLFGGKKKSREVVEDKYTRIIKRSEKGDYPPRIAPKITEKYENNTPSGKPKIMLYKEMKDEEDEDEISFERQSVDSFEELVSLVPKGSFVKAILQPKIWVVSGRYGVTLTVIQLLVEERKGGAPTSFAFGGYDKSSVKESSSSSKSKDDEDKSESKDDADGDSDGDDKSKEDETKAEDSDDDDDDESSSDDE